MKIVEKPWGKEIWFAVTKKYVGKILIVRKGHRMSKQYHKIKDETHYCDKGKYIMELGRKKLIIKEGDTVRIKPGTVHRIYAKYGDIKIIEVSTPHLKDRVRIEDDYGRQQKK